MNKKEAPTIIKKEKYRILIKINRVTSKPLTFLSFIWLILIILQLTIGLSRIFLIVFYVIWILFIADIVIKLIIAPDKRIYFKHEWLNIISLLIPGFRILNIFAGLRFIQLVNLYTSINRVRAALIHILKRRGFPYVISLTAVIILAGAVGILYYENPVSLHHSGIYNVRGIKNYGDALWWSAMMMTTMGSDYWPKTAEGRLLGWLIAMYAFTFFGYITAILASYFFESDKTNS